MSKGENITIRPHESSVKGGELLLLSFPDSIPDGKFHLEFRGTNQRHQVVAERNGTTSSMLQATIPAHEHAELVDLSVCYLDERGEQQTLYTSKFSYTVDEKQYMAELLVQSVTDSGVPLQYSLLPPLPTSESQREFDRSLTEALQTTELPKGWTLVGYLQEPLTNVEDCSPRETLIHFAARHGFNNLVQHLLTLPGAEVAAILPNERGQVPLDLTRENGNVELEQLLQLFINQKSNGLLTPDRLHPHSPKTKEKRSFEDLQCFKDINDQWITLVKRRKSSTCSTGPVERILNAKNRAMSPPLEGPSSSCERRRSIAIMDSSHILLHTIDITVSDPELAEMDRKRKTSWSKVVGSCASRSVGTGLNELDRITAEDSLQQKIQSELGRPGEGGENGMSYLSLNQAQLLYGLSTSCPALNEDSDSVAASAGLSAATTPGPPSPFSDDGERNLDLIEASSPQPLSQPVEVPSSTQSESSFSRTDTCSSTGSQPQKAVALIPQLITTEYSEQSATGEMTRVNENSNNSENSTSQVASYHSSLKGAPEESGREQTEGDLPTSKSAPDFFLSEDAELETEEEAILVPGQLRMKREAVVDGTTGFSDDHQCDSSTLEHISENELGTSTEDRLTEEEDARVTQSMTSPVKRGISVSFNKSHRRSRSTSEMELFSPSREQKLYTTEEGEDDDTSDWQPTLGSTHSIGNTTESSQSLSLEQTAAASGSSKEDRSRASSFLTNETSSLQESDTSDEEAAFHSAQESMKSPSHTSLDPHHTSNDSSVTVETSNSLNVSGMNHRQKHPSDSYDGVNDRSRRRHLNAVPAKHRYSADFLITNIDEYMNDSSEGELDRSGGPLHSHKRRLTATAVSFPVPTAGDSSADDLSDIKDHLSFENNSSTPDDLKHKKVSTDSVFENDHDVALSDVDVRLVSDDNHSPAMSQNLESSLERSLNSQDLSPKLTKRHSRSPLFSRRTVGKEASPKLRNRKVGGLTKSDVGPTIQALRNLVSVSPDSLSEGSDVTIGPSESSSYQIGPRTGSLSTPRSSEQVKRTYSTLSDSAMYNKEGLRIPTSTEESSTLDFSPTGSPRVPRKLQGDTLKHPPSPLSFSKSKSPTGSVKSMTNCGRSSTPSPGPLDPSVGQNQITSVKKTSSEENVHTCSDKETFSHPAKLKPNMRTMSIDEFFSHRPSKSPELITSFEHREALEEVPEEDLESSLGRNKRETERSISISQEDISETTSLPELEQSSEPEPQKVGWKRLIRGDFIRTSKNSRRGNKPKTRPKLGEHTFEELRNGTTEDIHPLESSQECVEASIRRTETMQINLSEKARKVLGIRRESEGSLPSSPTKLHHATSTLTPVQEAPPSSPIIRRPRSATSPAPISPTETSAPTEIRTPDTDSEPETHEDEQLVRTLSTSFPELAIKEVQAWDKTIDRRLYKRMGKGERERQAVIHELIQTEYHHLRVLKVLTLVFRQNVANHVRENIQGHLFPELDNLTRISEDFIERLEQKKERSDANIIDDISDVLLDQFSGDIRDQMLHAFGNFCSGHLTAMEIYKEHMRKRTFRELIKQLHALKECNRLTLPDFYTQVSQRLAQLVILLQRLVKKTDSLKLVHASRLRQSMANLKNLVTAVDKTVADHKNRMELMDIQSRLEISVPKSAKNCNRKEIKSLNLTARDRMLRKRGEAMWQGHGKQLSVHVVLVTDLLVLLTERDQKYNLAALQDLKPPVIRLYELHVRLNASVKSGVQLLLLEQGEHPEMFRLEFLSKKEAKQWESALNSAVEECKEKGLKCELFGSDKVLSGDDDRKSEEKEGDSDQEGVTDLNPSVKRWQQANHRLALATKILSAFAPGPTTATDASRQSGAAPGPYRTFKDSPKSRQRAQTTFHTHQRPKTAYFDDTDPTADTSTGKLVKVKKKSRVERSTTFRKEKEKEKEKGKGNEGGDGARGASEQQYVECISNLKESLEDIMSESEEKNKMITRLKEELNTLRESLSAAEEQKRVEQETLSVMMIQRGSRNSTPRGSPQQRPHSVHVDFTEDFSEEELGDPLPTRTEISDTGT